MAPAPTRRHLSERQVATVQNLIDSAMAELLDEGYDQLTVRRVAKRAGVTPATAYTYFDSKEHLVAELYWRRYASAPPSESPRGASLTQRVTDVLVDFTLCVANETDLAAACTVAVLADSPEVRSLRSQIGTELHRRLAAAAGPSVDPVALQTLEFATAGALLNVGTGHLTYDVLPDLLIGMTEIALGANR